MTKALKIVYAAIGVSTLGLFIPTTIWAASDNTAIGVTYVEEATLNLADTVRLEYINGEQFDPTGITFSYNDKTVEINEEIKIEYDFKSSGTRVVTFSKEEGNKIYRALLPVKVYLVRHLDVKNGTINRNKDESWDFTKIQVYAELNEAPKTFNIPNPIYPQVVELTPNQYNIALNESQIEGKYNATISVGELDYSYAYYDDLDFKSERKLVFSNLSGTSDKLTLYLESSSNNFFYPNNSKDVNTTGAYVYEDIHHKKTVYPFSYRFVGGTWGSEFHSKELNSDVNESLNGENLEVKIKDNITFSSSSWRDAILGTTIEPELLPVVPEVAPERILEMVNSSDNGNILTLYVTSNSSNYKFPDGTTNIDVTGRYILENSSGAKKAYPFVYHFLAGWTNNFDSHSEDKRINDTFINEDVIIGGVNFKAGFKVNIDGVDYYATDSMWHTPILGEEPLPPTPVLLSFIPNTDVNDSLKLVKNADEINLEIKLKYSTDGEHYDAVLTPEEIEEVLSDKILSIKPNGLTDEIFATNLYYNVNNELVASFNINSYQANEYNQGEENYKKIHSSNDLRFDLYVDGVPYDSINGVIKNGSNASTIVANDNYSFETIIKQNEEIVVRVNKIDDLIRFDHMGTNYNNETYNELDAGQCADINYDFYPRFIEEDSKLYLVLVGWTSDGNSILTDTELNNLEMSFVKHDDDATVYYTTTDISRYTTVDDTNTPTSVLGSPWGGARNFIKVNITDLHDYVPTSTGMRMVLRYLGKTITINGSNNHLVPTSNGGGERSFGGLIYKYHGYWGGLLEIANS